MGMWVSLILTAAAGTIMTGGDDIESDDGDDGNAYEGNGVQ